MTQAADNSPEDKTAEEIMDADTRTALAEVMAHQGARGEAAPSENVSEQTVADEEPPIVRLANTILQSAMKEQASDIHIEPEPRGVGVFFRIDGVRHEIIQMPSYIKMPLIQRYKYLADVNLLERHMPQRGYIGTRYGGQNYNLILATTPTSAGERLALRISKQETITRGLNSLGFTPPMQQQVEWLLERRGLLLLVGGAGQGKTTTEYVLLHQLVGQQASAITVAEFHDYNLAGITQTKLNPRANYTAREALKSIARIDYDVVALDGVLDSETLELALDMAADRLVIATLSGFDMISAIRRVDSWGIERARLADGLTAILAQSLIRHLCNDCKEEYTVPARDLRRFGYAPQDPVAPVLLIRGSGCEVCRNTGYKGRMGLFELAEFSDEMKDMLTRNAPFSDLKEAAKANGMKELREDGLVKFLQGITTPEEVLRHCF